MTDDRFHCPYCGDEMHAKFTRSHLLLCLLAERLLAPRVEQLVDEIQEQQ